MIKKVTKKIVNESLTLTKKVIIKSPRLKNYIKNTIHAQYPVSKNEFTISVMRELAYSKFVINNYPDSVEVSGQKTESKKFKNKPLISIITPLYNTPKELLEECIESVIGQSYENWELLLVNDASTDKQVEEVAKGYSSRDKRIKYKSRKTNGHISAASNDALKIASGDYIALLDHDDMLWPNALYENVKVINKTNADFIYSDEDKITEDRKDHKIPFFKPDWNPEFLEGVNYITHFSVIRKSIVDKVGGFRSECNGAQDWDLFLRVSEHTSKIEHIPKVLYSWRIIEASTASNTSAKPYVVAAQKKALTDHFDRIDERVKVGPGIINDYWFSKRELNEKPKVSIVIPTKNQFKIVKRCVDSIIAKTTYKNYEIILVDTGSDDQKVFRWYKTIESNQIKIFDWKDEKFSYSKSCNYGASKASGKYLVMLNNDTEVKTKDWLEVLLSDAQREDVAAVGCKLFYPDDMHIQHAGIGIGIGGIAANLLAAVPNNRLTPLQHLYANNRHEVTAVTAACLMIESKKFNSVGGFDEELRVTYNDVDLCLRLRDKGYRNIYNPHAELLHHESISVGRPEEKKRDTAELDKAAKLFKDRWDKYIIYDPNLNPNLDKDSASMELPIIF